MNYTNHCQTLQVSFVSWPKDSSFDVFPVQGENCEHAAGIKSKMSCLSCFCCFRCYILTQGPLKETTWHFWYMVYQTRSSAIVMLCKLTENGLCKCCKYWPDSSKPEDIARDENTGLEVSLLSEEVNKISSFLIFRCTLPYFVCIFRK